MTSRVVERAVWAGAIALIGLAGTALRGNSPESSPARTAYTPVQRAAATSPESVSVWAQATIARDPFRLSRRPAALRFGETRDTAVVPPPPLRPVLSVLGVTGGPPWQAVLLGIPGRSEGVLVREGREVEGLRIRRITRDSVVVAGMDTVWTLAVRRGPP